MDEIFNEPVHYENLELEVDKNEIENICAFYAKHMNTDKSYKNAGGRSIRQRWNDGRKRLDLNDYYEKICMPASRRYTIVIIHSCVYSSCMIMFLIRFTSAQL